MWKKVLALALLVATLPGATLPGCNGGGTSTTASLKREWTLFELNGEPITLSKPPTLRFSEPNRVSGFGGCNQMSGAYQLSGTALTFSPFIMTKMACGKGMDVERAFAIALGATKRYVIKGTELELMGESGILARLRIS
jgi:copper homeostasis protein (lipoprotein)